MLISCDEMFDTHPYDVDFSGEPGINDKQIAKIRQAFDEPKPFNASEINKNDLFVSLVFSISMINRDSSFGQDTRQQGYQSD